ncbi:uncharacterized protein LOC141685702 [Apium graveolens]|uniref:uncharacterized protein LOC141685702 n=1 Tax=Apium graveolens TaxID=4045 RepID=UPI003D79FB16
MNSGVTSVASAPVQSTRPVVDCMLCGKKHSGQCRKDVQCFKCDKKGHYALECNTGNIGVTCFKCHKVGHISRNCKTATQGSVGWNESQGPATSTTRARTFKMTKRSTAQDSDVVADTLSLNFVPVKVLFDSGASKSFISKECVSKMNLILEDLNEPLLIEVANQDTVSVNRLCPRCHIEIGGHFFSVDLLPFQLGEFDVILGMDWLSQHKANTDCKKKKVLLYSEDNRRIVYQGQKQDKKFLSILEAKTLLRKGCEAYLAHVVDTEKKVVVDEAVMTANFGVYSDGSL